MSPAEKAIVALVMLDAATSHGAVPKDLLSALGEEAVDALTAYLDNAALSGAERFDMRHTLECIRQERPGMALRAALEVADAIVDARISQPPSRQAIPPPSLDDAETWDDEVTFVPTGEAVAEPRSSSAKALGPARGFDVMA